MDEFLKWLNGKINRATKQRDEECNNLRLLNEEAFLSRVNKSNTPELIRSLSDEISLLEEVKREYESNKS